MPVSQAQRRFDRFGQALFHVAADYQPVDDDLDVVVDVTIESLYLVDAAQIQHLAVDAHACIALPGEVAELRVVVALAAAHHRRKHLESGTGGKLHDPIHDLLRRLALDDLSGLRIVLEADAGVQQPQVVVYLRDRSDCGARVAAGAFLIDGDRRRQAFEKVHIGLVHLPEELARIGRERLDIAPLPLGVDRVEGERRLAAARQPGENDHAIARQFDIHIAQVVLPRTADDQPLTHAAENSLGARPFTASLLVPPPVVPDTNTSSSFVQLSLRRLGPQSAELGSRSCHMKYKES